MSWSRKKYRSHVTLVTGLLLFTGCNADEIATPRFLTHDVARSLIPASFPVVVQGATTGVKGEILQPPTAYSVCGFGTLSYADSIGVTWTKECDTRLSPPYAYAPYDGGSVTVFLVNGGTFVHLGTIRAKWERLVLSGMPAGSHLRMSAWPESSSTGLHNYEFDVWLDWQGQYSTRTIDRVVWGGEEFLALLYKLPSNSGGGTGGGDPCIICG